ncbi:maltose ABC transporter permease MalG [Natronospirillum operosum]|uniref:maltose ABC transporter permease MalG n=1 Tax=Natronospirillum operosum TaxID=2759953 RepID=UPI001F0F0E12|nr:maltose ABC transporter permease MalG [Natronospirillum operosum]
MIKTTSVRARVWATHAFLIGFSALVLFPLAMIISISFREGNFARGNLIPQNFTLEHWTLALGQTYVGTRNNATVFSPEAESVRASLGLGRVTVERDGSWALDVQTSVNPQHFPLDSHIQLTNFQAGTELARSERIDFRLVANEEQAAAAPEGKQVVRVGEQHQGQIDLPDEFARIGGLRLNYGVAFHTPPPFPVLTWLWNSVKVAFSSAFLILGLATISAYAFARMRFNHKTTILRGMLILQMFPPFLALVALYNLFDRLGDYVPWLGIDTHGAYILAMVGGISLMIWMIIGYFSTIDVSLEEAAAMDGATPWQTFYRILLPLSVPILAVVFIISFINAINEFALASALLRSTDKLTLAVGSTNYFHPQNTLWGNYAAAAVLSGLPITVVFLIMQRFLVSGLTAGGVKG